MRTITFRNNDQLPAIGLGTWKSTKNIVGEAIKTAIKLGYRHIDCAAIYGNEAEIGTAIAAVIASGLVSREELWITSKLWNTAHRPEDVRPALEQTLTDLQLDYLDLYLIHWPIAMKANQPFPFTAEAFIPIEEMPLIDTWKAMEQCYEAGLVRHLGVSNFSAQKIKALSAAGKHPIEVNQVESHPLLQQKELFAVCKDLGIAMTAYSPLGTGNRSINDSKQPKPNLFELPEIVDIASKHSCTPAQVLVGWQMLRGWSVIPKSTNPERLQQNLNARNLELTDEEMAVIDRLDQHHRMIDGTFWTPPGGPYTLENLWDE